jgi:methyltransferase OMS1, mitochondrial
MASNVRKVAMVAAGGIVYTCSSLAVYKFMTQGSDEMSQVREETKDGFSFVQDPQRNRTFQKVAEFYDSQIGRDEAVMGINWLRWMLLRSHATGTVLEVGAGTGRNLSFYPNAVDRVVLADASDRMLMQAKTKLRELNEAERKRFATIEADASNLEFPDSCFDTVVDTFGLCSYDQPVLVLKEMARVCKPDGKILLLEHGRSKMWESLSQYLDKHAERHAKNWGCVWNRDLDLILQEAGLSLDRVDTWHFGTTYYVVCRPGEKAVVSNKLLAAQFFSGVPSLSSSRSK